MSKNAASGFALGVLNSYERSEDQKEREAARQKPSYQPGYNPNAPQNYGGNPQSYGAGPDNSGYGARPAGGGGQHDGTLEGILNVREAGEWNTLFGNAERGGRFDGVDVSRMTIDQLSDFTQPSGEYGQWVKGKIGRVATPTGKYQVVGTTLRNTAQQMGLPGDTVYDENTQRQMFHHLAGSRLKSANTPAGRRAAFRAEWEGLKHVPDSELDAAIAQYEQQAQQPQQAPQAAPAMGVKPPQRPTWGAFRTGSVQ